MVTNINLYSIFKANRFPTSHLFQIAHNFNNEYKYIHRENTSRTTEYFR